MLGKIEGRRRKEQQRMRWLDGQPNGHECKQTPGDGEGQGSLVCCSPWGRKESDTTEQLNNNNLNIKQVSISDPRRPGGRVGINDIIGNLGFSFR